MPSSSASVAETPSSSPRGEPPLDVASLRRRVAGAIRREPVLVLAAEPSECEAMDELRGPAALRKAQRPQPAFDELGEQAGPLPERAGAEVELLVGHRRIPEHDRALRPRRGVSGDDRRLQPRQRRRELAGFAIVADASRNCGSAP